MDSKGIEMKLYKQF